ncbi:MAG: hypothetical protein PHD82_06745 [Candidatus Riflebacteria bacterium]|nr:hypothetical protein [Candidatus Riflebacteria bacterium]
MKPSQIKRLVICAGILLGMSAFAVTAEGKVAAATATADQSTNLETATENLASASETLQATMTTDSADALPEKNIAGELSEKSGEETDLEADLQTDKNAEHETEESAAAIENENENEDEGEEEEEVKEEVAATVYDPFAAEPFAGTSLVRMKRRLQHLAKTSFAMQKTADLGLAIVAASSDDRFFRRTGEFSLRISRHLPFSALACIIILPEFINIADELMIRATRKLINASTENRPNNRQQFSQMLDQLEAMNELAIKVAEHQRQVQMKLRDLIRQLVWFNDRRFIKTATGEIIKNSNSAIHKQIEKHLNIWKGLLNQFDHHQEYFSGQLKYLKEAGTGLAGVRKASHLNLMLRSLLDLKILVEKAYASFSGCPARAEEWQRALHTDLESQTLRSNRMKARINDFIGKFPARDIEESSAPTFSAEKELENTFDLLEKMATIKPADAIEPVAEVDHEKTSEETEEEPEKLSLIDLLRPYISGNPLPEPEPEPEIEAAPELSEESPVESEDGMQAAPEADHEDSEEIDAAENPEITEESGIEGEVAAEVNPENASETLPVEETDPGGAKEAATASSTRAVADKKAPF